MAGRFNLKPSSATHRRHLSTPSIDSVEHQVSVIQGIFPLFPRLILGTHPFLKESQISEYDNYSSGYEQPNLIDPQPKEPVQLEVQKSTTTSFESQVQHNLPPPPTHVPQPHPPRKVPRPTGENIQFRPRHEKALEEIKLKSESDQYEQSANFHRAEHETMSGEHQKLESLAIGQDETVLKLQSERGQYEQSARFHSAEHQTMLAKYQKYRNLAIGQQEEIKHVRKDCERTAAENKQWEERCVVLEKDNDLLRGQIIKMSSAQEPIHEEEWFILQFGQIGMEIDSWAAKETRGKLVEPLSAADHQWLVERLTSFGRVGKMTVEMLGSRLADMYQDRRKKITLIRHIVAILLCEDVFQPFSFGLGPEKSEYCKQIEIDLCLRGSNPSLEHTDG
jgi:hypothetical protein